MRRRSIVYVVPGFPASEVETDCLPPVQNFVKSIAQRNREIAVRVVSLQYPFKRSVYMWNGATVHAIGGRNKRFPFRLWSWIEGARQVRRLMRSFDVTALHSFWLAECSYVASWLARMSGTKHIATICGQDAQSGNPYLKHLRFDTMIVTAPSQFAADVFSKSTGRRVNELIPTGLDAEALAIDPDSTLRPIDILGVGSLSRTKNFSLFVDIVSKLRRDYPALKCVIVGEGPERPSLERQIREKDLNDVIQLAGHLPRERVLSIMRSARILLHTSGYEGQGYVFLEALAAGMRVVNLDVGYTPNVDSAYRCKTTENILSVLPRLLTLREPLIKAQIDRIEDTAFAFERIYGIA